MEISTKQINSGIYLIIDPSMNEEELLSKLKIVLKENLAAIQIWDHFSKVKNTKSLFKKILNLTIDSKTPTIINNKWELLKDLPFDGVHFDKMPYNLTEIKTKLNRSILLGITCNNDVEQIKQAKKQHFDYISFCSMFPSSTANSCQLVNFETIHQARKIFDGKIFLAGGINEKNINHLKPLHYDGIAMISGIMSNEKPLEIINVIKKNIKK